MLPLSVGDGSKILASGLPQSDSLRHATSHDAREKKESEMRWQMIARSAVRRHAYVTFPLKKGGLVQRQMVVLLCCVSLSVTRVGER